MRLKNAIAMKILDLLGAGGSFTEFYAMDFSADLVLMGHDGPGHIGIAQDRIRVRPLSVYHGKLAQVFRSRCLSDMGPSRCCQLLKIRSTGSNSWLPRVRVSPARSLRLETRTADIDSRPGRAALPKNGMPRRPAHHCAIGAQGIMGLNWQSWLPLCNSATSEVVGAGEAGLIGNPILDVRSSNGLQLVGELRHGHVLAMELHVERRACIAGAGFSPLPAGEFAKSFVT